MVNNYEVIVEAQLGLIEEQGKRIARLERRVAALQNNYKAVEQAARTALSGVTSGQDHTETFLNFANEVQAASVVFWQVNDE
jgi:hypothetical protein